MCDDCHGDPEYADGQDGPGVYLWVNGVWEKQPDWPEQQRIETIKTDYV